MTIPLRPVYIETQYAYYILDKPSHGYTETFKHFVTPRLLAQMLFESILHDPHMSLLAFTNHLATKVDMFGRTWLESDFHKRVI